MELMQVESPAVFALPEAEPVRRNIEAVARALRLTPPASNVATLAFRLGSGVRVTVAPGSNDRLVVMLRIAAADEVPPALWVSALSEAAEWGLGGERQRFVVVDGRLTLLWTTPPLAERDLLDQLYELLATAAALAAMCQEHAAR